MRRKFLTITAAIATFIALTKTKKIIAILLLLSLISCKEKKAITISDAMIFSHDQIVEIDRIGFDNAEYIDSCVFIPLETSDQSLIGGIAQIETADGKYYILDKQTNNNKLKVYDCTGHFLYDIGKKGNGPGEYIAINAFFINLKEKKIGMFDPIKVAIHEYSLEGGYMRTVTHNRREFFSIEKATWTEGCIYCSRSIVNEYANNTMYVLLSPEDYSVIEKLRQYPVKPDEQMSVSLMHHPCCIVDGKFHYTSLFSDTVYSYDNGKETPYLFVETGKPCIPPTYFKSRKIENDPMTAFIEIWKNDDYSRGFTEFGETDNFVLLQFKVINSFYFMDKKAKKGFHVKDNSLPDLGLPDLVDGNKVIRIWSPDNVEAYKNRDVEHNERIKTLLKKYDPDNNNPILVIYYMKNK